MKTNLKLLIISLSFLFNSVFAQQVTRDANGNITEEIYTNPDGTTTIFTYVYDANGLRTSHAITTATTGLPIELASFKVSKGENSQKTAIVEWTTASEKNNAYFVVSHSLDGQNFTSIGQVPTKNGNSNILQFYKWIHQNPNWGRNYYRLKQVDTDGKSDSTGIKSVYFEPNWEIKLYPNPAQKEATLEILGLSQGETVKIDILEVQGRVLPRRIRKNSSYQWKIDTSYLSSGLYFVRIQIGNTNPLQKKLLIQR